MGRWIHFLNCFLSNLFPLSSVALYWASISCEVDVTPAWGRPYRFSVNRKQETIIIYDLHSDHIYKKITNLLVNRFFSPDVHEDNTSTQVQIRTVNQSFEDINLPPSLTTQHPLKIRTYDHKSI